MGLFNLFKPKEKQNVDSANNVKVTKILGGSGSGKIRLSGLPEELDEEYVLPELSRGRFTMTDELRRRKENEELKRKYGVVTEKEGNFL